jgi:hypothetical protein
MRRRDLLASFTHRRQHEHLMTLDVLAAALYVLGPDKTASHVLDVCRLGHSHERQCAAHWSTDPRTISLQAAAQIGDGGAAVVAGA